MLQSDLNIPALSTMYQRQRYVTIILRCVCRRLERSGLLDKLYMHYGLVLIARQYTKLTRVLTRPRSAGFQTRHPPSPFVSDTSWVGSARKKRQFNRIFPSNILPPDGAVRKEISGGIPAEKI